MADLDDDRPITDEEAERIARNCAQQAHMVKVMALTLGGQLRDFFGVLHLPIVLGLFDAALAFSKVMITQASQHDGDAGVRGVLTALDDKIQHVQTHLANHSRRNREGKGADTASRN